MKNKIILLFTIVFLFNFYIFAGSKAFYSQGCMNKKEFALTYDDGPGFITAELLDTLKKYNVKATFFLLGENIKRYPELVKRIYAEGHLIGSHTYSHKNFFIIDKKNGKEEILKEEILKTENELKKIGLSKPIFLRMPNGFSKKWAIDIASSMNYTLVNWTFGIDWHNIPQEKMEELYLKAIKPGAIILLHDGGGKKKKKTIEITEKILKEAYNNGFKAVRIDEILCR